MKKAYENMKVAKKLIIGFLVIIILAVLVGATGIVGMIRINNAETALYEQQTKPLPDIAKVLEYSQRLRIQLRNVILYREDAEKLRQIEVNVNDQAEQFEGYLAAYDVTIINSDARVAFNEAKNLYKTMYQPGMDRILAGAKAGNSEEELLAIMEEIGPATDKMVESFTMCMDIKVSAAKAASDSDDELAQSSLTLIIVVLVIAIVLSIAIAYYISQLISKPLVVISDFLKKAGETGDINLRSEDVKNIEALSDRLDELGECNSACASFVGRMLDISKSLETLADGDLTAEVTLLSQNDTMGLSLQKMIGNMNDMFGEVKNTAVQVSTAAEQIADGAQSLAEGSTDQASVVEELSASVSEISDKTQQNASMAREAADMSFIIKNNAEKGSTQMEHMMQSVKEINDASNQIEKVIKVIDDIAFQTNILALNAAVEAARAGEHGKGFAVVAEEVRNLAAKSAAAAKDTGGLIENSIEKANLGLSIATETSGSLKEIVEGINRSSEIVAQIAESSDMQASAIVQINTGIDQVAQVVQQNSATAQESAAASEEMSGQSQMLETLVSQFKLKNASKR